MNNSGGLAGRNALITGSTQGIGRAIALAFAGQGVNVLIHGRDEAEAGRETVGAVRALGVRSELALVDLLNADAARQLADTARQHLDAIDILILCASMQIRKPWTEVTAAEFGEQATVNWQRSLELVQALAPAMQRRGWGRILTIGSVQQTRPHPQMIAYAATKAAQVNMVKNLARQLAPDGITVNNLAPGVMLTDRNADALADESYREQVRQRIPAGFFGEPGDCTGLALLLCSEAGRYITGQDIFVDGGMSL